MSALKTKCKQCYHIGANVTQEPCNKCNEIQTKFKNHENFFMDGSKNLMKED